MVDAREYLAYFRIADSKIDLKLKQIRSLEERLCNISPHTDSEQVAHTRNDSIMAETVAVIVDIQNDIDLRELKNELNKEIESIKPYNKAV